MPRTQTEDESTILIVDDRQENLQVIGATLSPFRYELLLATSGEQALERIDARIPDLILLDIVMPGMDGIETCGKIKNLPDCQDVPIIFLSAHTDKNLIVRALESGGVDYITKPFNKAELISRVRANIALRTAQRRTEAILTEQENFVATLAHDLRNPLSGAKFSLDLLKESDATLPDMATKLIATSHDALTSALSLLEELLDDFAQANTLPDFKLEPVDFCAVVREAYGIHCEHAKKKSLTFDLDCPEGEHLVAADQTALQRVISNLISNALKFTPHGKQVDVKVDLKPNNRIVCYVIDSGPGITTEDQKKLFQRFTRLSAQPTGGETSTGLGLSIAKSLVDAMAGELTCESDDGEGAIFSVSMNRHGVS